MMSSPGVASSGLGPTPLSFTTAPRVIVLAVCVAGFLLLALHYGTAEVGGRTYRVLDDDFMISQRYARNLARGDGLVWNAGERVEGFSNPFTVLAISYPLELAGLDPATLGFWVWAANALFHGLIVVLLLARTDGGTDVQGILAALVYLTLSHHAFFSHAGLEVYLQALLLLALVRGLQQGGALFWIPMALLPVVHPGEVPSWLGAGALHLLHTRAHWRREVLRLAAAAIPAGAYAAFRLGYYGQLVPNTYRLKVTGVMFPGRGLHYLEDGFALVAPVLAVLALAYLRRDRRPPSLFTLAVLFGPYLVAVARLGGDTIPFHRMVFVLIPALLFTAAEWCRAPMARWRRAVAVGAVAAQLVVSAASWRRADAANRQILEWERSRIALGLAIHSQTSPGQTVALFGLGLAGYFADRPVIDMLGKTDSHIARTEAKHWRQVAHQKSDPAYVVRRRPEYVEMPYTRKLVADRLFLRGQRRKRWGYFAELALEPSFREAYVPVATRGRPLPLWQRKDLPPTVWTVPAEGT